jgi:hypothetical protein
MNEALNDSVPIVQGQPYNQQRDSFEIQNNFNYNNNGNQVPQKTYIIKDSKNVDPLAHLNDGL